MKIYKYVKAQQQKEEGAFSLNDVQKNAPDLYQHVQGLSAEEISKIIFSKEFVPLDFVALIYRLNPDEFANAIQKQIYYLLTQNTKYQMWLKEMNLDLSEAAGLIFTEMLSDNPLGRGVLNQITLDGSYANTYRYERAENIDVANKLRGTLGISNGITVPHCPTCKELGIDQPFWSYEINNGKLQTKFYMYQDRCANIEEIKSQEVDAEQAQQIMEERGQEILEEEPTLLISLGDDIFLVTTDSKNFIVELTPEQAQALRNKQRNFQLFKGKLLFRCTFEAMIPAFTAFFGYATVQREISKIWQNWQRQHGKMTDHKKIDRYKKLIEKMKTEKLSSEEQAELSKLRKYKERRDKQFVSAPQSFDSAVKGGESSDKDRTLHEKVTREVEDDFDPEVVREAELNLSDFLDNEEFEMLETLKSTGHYFLQAIDEYKNYTGMRAKDRSNEAKLQMLESLRSVAKKLVSGEKKSFCAICNFAGGTEDKQCNIALKMQREIYDTYVKSSGVTQFFSLVKKLGEKEAVHFEKSQLRDILVDLLSAEIIEVDEDDAETLDLSGFDKKKKLTQEEFLKEIRTNLPAPNLRIFNGITMQSESGEGEAKPIDEKLIDRVAKEIGQLIAKVDEEDLLEELLIFHRS